MNSTPRLRIRSSSEMDLPSRVPSSALAALETEIAALTARWEALEVLS